MHTHEYMCGVFIIMHPTNTLDNIDIWVEFYLPFILLLTDNMVYSVFVWFLFRSFFAAAVVVKCCSSVRPFFHIAIFCLLTHFHKYIYFVGVLCLSLLLIVVIMFTCLLLLLLSLLPPILLMVSIHRKMNSKLVARITNMHT